MKKAIILILLPFFIFPVVVLAKIGVGVGTGKIEVNDELKPGVIYELPPLTVLNTGDVASEYEVGISYHEKQPELAPPESWFQFSPKTFYLEPGAAQAVAIKLDLPLSIEPGQYFAYLEARPAKKGSAGGTSVGIAAAAKLYFTTVPGTFLEGIYYKLLSIWNIYSPVPQIVVGIVALATLFTLFKKFFNIEINVKKN